MTRVYVVLDVGGTTTDVAVVEDSVIVARTSLQSFKPQPLTAYYTDELCRFVGGWLAAKNPAYLNPEYILLGVSGIWDVRERQGYQIALAHSWTSYVSVNCPRITILADAELALFAAVGSAAGTLLIAGTGSIAIRRNHDGHVIRAGGWGPRIDDAGGGFWIGREALRAVARELDGRAEHTQLRNTVASFLRVDSSDQSALQSALRQAHIDTVAVLAPTVLACAYEGDAVSRAIVEAAADELAALVEAIHVHDYTVWAHGSLFQSSYFTNCVTSSVLKKTCADELHVIRDVVEGAVLHLHGGLQKL